SQSIKSSLMREARRSMDARSSMVLCVALYLASKTQRFSICHFTFLICHLQRGRMAIDEK
ncbi:MAG: hypothetical protein ACREA9_23060, partial [Pyrinomonadaceae bacterium]